jgi:hypothetical protein
MKILHRKKDWLCGKRFKIIRIRSGTPTTDIWKLFSSGGRRGKKFFPISEWEGSKISWVCWILSLPNQIGLPGYSIGSLVFKGKKHLMVSLVNRILFLKETHKYFQKLCLGHNFNDLHLEPLPNLLIKSSSW